MHTINMQVRGRLLPELRVNGCRVYLDPIDDPDLDPDTIDEKERVRMPRRQRRHSITRWNP